MDNDVRRYAEEVLQRWKNEAERAALARVGKTDGFCDRHNLWLSSEEVELLRSANLVGGKIIVLSSEQQGRWVSAGYRDFLHQDDPAVAVTYVEALESLCKRGLAKYDGIDYLLTAAGFKLARTMLAEGG